MNTRHKHYDAIIAWAEGKTIQSWCHGSHTWLDWDLDEVAPSFHPDGKFRAKPEALRYRNFLLKTNNGRHYVGSATEASDKEDPREKWSLFVRWLGDWQEVEI